MLQQMAHLLLLLLFLLFLCHLWRRTHTLPKPSALPENQGCRSFIMKGAGHLELKFVVRAHESSCGFCKSLRTCQTEWVWKSRWHRGEFVFASKLSGRSILNIYWSHKSSIFKFLVFPLQIKKARVAPVLTLLLLLQMRICYARNFPLKKNKCFLNKRGSVQNLYVVTGSRWELLKESFKVFISI